MDRLESRTLLSAPTIDGTLGDQVIAETQVLALFAGVVIDVPEMLDDEVIVTIEHDSSQGVLAGAFEQVDGVSRFEGTASEATAAIRGLRFDPTDGRVDVGETEETRFTVRVENDLGQVIDDRTSVVSVAIDGTPRILGTLLDQTTTDTSTIQPFTNVQFASPGREHAMHTLTIEIDNDAKGEILGHGSLVELHGTPDVLTDAVRALVFQPSSNRVAPGEIETTGFTIDITVDGDRSTDLGTTVRATSINDAPVISGAGRTHLIGEHESIAPFVDMRIEDVDRPGQTLEVTITLDGNGSLVQNGTSIGDSLILSGTSAEIESTLATITYRADANTFDLGRAASARIDLAVTDGLETREASQHIVIAALNDPTRLENLPLERTTHDDETVQAFPGVVVVDPDSPAQDITVIVEIERGSFTAESLLDSGFRERDHDFVYVGSATSATTALRTLIYEPERDTIAPGETDRLVATIRATDHLGDAALRTVDFAVRSVNDAPTVRGGLELQHVDDIDRIEPFARLTIADVDRPSQDLRVRIEMDDADKGVFTAASVEEAGFRYLQGGIEYRGTAADATAAIRRLVFSPTDDRVERGTFEVTTFTVIVDDGMADPVIDASTSVASLRPNRVPVLTSIATLQGSAATQSFEITYEMLLDVADVTDDDGDAIVFRIGEVQEGTLTKNGQSVLAGQTFLAPGESVIWTSLDGVKRTRPAFDVRAFDGEGFSDSRTVRVYVRFDSDAAAADDADVEIASTFEGVLTVVSRSSEGRLIILQQADPSGPWTRISALDGVEGVADTITWVDEGVTYVGFTMDGTFRTIRNVDGEWIERNVTGELVSGHAIEGTLTTFETNDDVRVIAGLNGDGDVIAYLETAFRNSDGTVRWTSRNLSEEIRARGGEVPRFEGDLISYVTSWNGLNIAGLDASGDIWSVWTGGGISTWFANNLSDITDAPTLHGKVTTYLTPWGGINLAGVDDSGDLVVTWWVPGFEGEWRKSNFTDMFGGPALSPGTLTSYVTPWSSFNIAGVDDLGNVIQYWWIVPESPDQSGWTISQLADGAADEFLRFADNLTGLATEDIRLNLLGTSEDGSIMRLWWQPDSTWSLENLTDLV